MTASTAAPQEAQATVAGVPAVVAAPGSEIATLPPQPYSIGTTGYPISSRTGEPRRPVVLGVACGLLYAASVTAAVGLVTVLWDAASVIRFHTSARLIDWIRPEIVSFTTVMLVLAVGVIGALTVATPSVVAYNAWNGQRWARVAGLVMVAVMLLTILLNAWTMWAIAPAVAGAALLWLPAYGRYAAAWTAIRTAPPPGPMSAAFVFYGPLPRYQ